MTLKIVAQAEPDETADWQQAVLTRERGPAAAAFVYGVRSTKIYCRAYCPSKRPNLARIEYFRTPAEAEARGYRACLRCCPADGNQSAEGALPGYQAVLNACALLQAETDSTPNLGELAARVGLSPSHLQRTFKRQLGVSPREFAAACRMQRFRDALRSGRPVGEALVEAGYGSTSRIYEGCRAASKLGALPSDYRKGRNTMPVRYAMADYPNGRFLVAATERGICSVALSDTPDVQRDDPVAELLREYPQAAPLQEGEENTPQAMLLSEAVPLILRHLDGNVPNLRLPRDVRATAFQEQVWQALQEIPYGQTRSYAQIADTIGRPTAARAVARACASNPTALIVPCHRVVRGGGELSGYRWGPERKAALLEIERNSACAPTARAEAT